MTSSYKIEEGRIHIGTGPNARTDTGAGKKSETSVSALVKSFETPFFFYNLDHIQSRAELLKQTLTKTHKLPVTIHYATKANANPAILKHLKSLGLAVDVVSQGEFECALRNGFKAEDVLFSGVAKTRRELEAAMKIGVKQINVESLGELERIEQLLMEKPNLTSPTGLSAKPVSIGLRLNPNVSPETHPYITTGLKENKFGLEESAVFQAMDLLAKTTAPMRFRGLSLHIGSQLLDLSALKEAIEIGLVVQKKCRERLPEKDRAAVDRFDVGGGIGINYDTIDETIECQVIAEYAKLLHDLLGPEIDSGRLREILIEPGRWLVARSGLLVTEVQYTKKTQHKSFVIVDGGMNLLIRPALYEAEHRIAPLDSRKPEPLASSAGSVSSESVDVVGPICESADFLGRDRKLPPVLPGDRLAVFDAGAYGRTMASNYNQCGWPAEYVFSESSGHATVVRADSV